MINIESVVERRRLLRWLTVLPSLGFLGGVAGCQQTPRVYDLQVSRDAGCSCCHAWTEIVKASGRFQVTLTDVPDMAGYKQRAGVPAGLGACHTAVVENLIIEGHVPVEDILRLLSDRPVGVKGIAVAGMPRGSPGMEQPGGAVDAYEVIAFTTDGRQSVFGRHPKGS